MKITKYPDRKQPDVWISMSFGAAFGTGLVILLRLQEVVVLLVINIILNLIKDT